MKLFLLLLISFVTIDAAIQVSRVKEIANELMYDVIDGIKKDDFDKYFETDTFTYKCCKSPSINYQKVKQLILENSKQNKFVGLKWKIENAKMINSNRINFDVKFEKNNKEIKNINFIAIRDGNGYLLARGRQIKC
ncbi:unnamed protein product [Caenorhabditis angaria]|uniref:NTF2-like domain-containing protein n=1 Tax=Caenorhabditis angaria TaxID=860376 RepID=A0A9P1IE18_9PELO|nr:unnamed protein product [Caenorhabditis angaria]